MGLGHEFDAHLLLAFQEIGGYRIGLVLEFRDAVFACVVHLFHQDVVDEDVELVGLSFAHAPVLETQREVGLSACLHEIAEVMAIASIAEEYVVVGAHL